MGRNIFPGATPAVPINGSIYRNSNQSGIVTDANGCVYFPSNQNGLLSATDFPKYVSTNGQLVSVPSGFTPMISNPSGAVNGGVITNYPTFNFWMNQYTPVSYSYLYGYNAFKGQRGKNRFVGMSANSGAVGAPTVMQYQSIGYQYGGSNPQNDNPVYSFSSTGEPIALVTRNGFGCWYDSSTSTYRVLADNNRNNSGGGSSVLLTSSDGLTWTSAAISANQTYNIFGYYYSGNYNYYNQSFIASGQKVFVTLTSTANNAAYCIFASTNGGATFADVTSAVNSGNNYLSFHSTQNLNHVAPMYDGTTLFVPMQGTPKFSTNDGTTFAISTVTGSNPWNTGYMKGCTLGANASTFMYVNNSNAWVTTNGGQSFTNYSWTPAATISSSYNQFNPMDYDTANSRWCFLYGTTSGVYAASSTNNGATWSHGLVTGTESLGFQYQGYLVYAGDAFYAVLGSGNSASIFRSTNASTWTYITAAGQFNYGQPYWVLNDYVGLGNVVIKKSNQAVLNTYASTINATNSWRVFGNYVSADLWVSGVNGYNFIQACSSSNMGSATYFAPYPYNNQQGTNNPQTIEYWRIK